MTDCPGKITLANYDTGDSSKKAQTKLCYSVAYEIFVSQVRILFLILPLSAKIPQSPISSVPLTLEICGPDFVGHSLKSSWLVYLCGFRVNMIMETSHFVCSPGCCCCNLS